MSAFTKTLTSFCEELRLTFPELSAPVDRATRITPEQFWHTWGKSLSILLERDVKRFMEERGGFLVGAIRLTPALWSELSEKTQGAIWKYMRTMALEAAMELHLDSMDTDTMQTLMDILTAERLEAGGAEADVAASEMFEETMGHLNPLMEKLKGMMGGFMDVSGLADIPLPEIPERLRNGRIAKLAEEMAKQFKPEEFGIDPALLKGDNVEDILKRLAELYQRDPTLLIAGAKRVAERIKKQILGGSLNREELVAEAQEFVTLFKEHPLFKEAIAKFQGLVGEGGLAEMFGGASSAGAPSERRRAVQERLRKKMEARRGGGAAAGGAGAAAGGAGATATDSSKKK
jgi:hypothetical protein